MQSSVRIEPSFKILPDTFMQNLRLHLALRHAQLCKIFFALSPDICKTWMKVMVTDEQVVCYPD